MKQYVKSSVNGLELRCA